MIKWALKQLLSPILLKSLVGQTDFKYCFSLLPAYKLIPHSSQRRREGVAGSNYAQGGEVPGRGIFYT